MKPGSPTVRLPRSGMGELELGRELREGREEREGREGRELLLFMSKYSGTLGREGGEREGGREGRRGREGEGGGDGWEEENKW